MKRWAIVTVLLYALVLILLTVPVFLLALGKWWGHQNSGGGIVLADAIRVFQDWGYWLSLSVLVLGQALMLIVPVNVSQRRLTSRRKLFVPIITAAFLFANIVFAGIVSLACAIAGDEAFKVLQIFGGSESASWSALVLITILLWTIWGLVFYRMTKANEPQDAVARLTRWLLHGSILELLVAVPSHVIVRNREVCCAPAASFWGIATGLSVMLLCYGPGVYFLFARRFARKRPSID